MIGDWRLKDDRSSWMSEFSGSNDKLYIVLWWLLMKLTCWCHWRLLGHGNPTLALQVPQAGQKYRFFMKSGVILRSLRSSFWGLWESFWCLQASGAEHGGFEQALGTITAFSSILGSAPRCSEGFSLQRELCFRFGDQWQTMWTFGSISERFWEPNAQLYSLWSLPEPILGGKMGCRLIVSFLLISRGSQDSENIPSWG